MRKKIKELKMCLDYAKKKAKENSFIPEYPYFFIEFKTKDYHNFHNNSHIYDEQVNNISFCMSRTDLNRLRYMDDDIDIIDDIGFNILFNKDNDYTDLVFMIGRIDKLDTILILLDNLVV